jgi:hypothetical protein
MGHGGREKREERRGKREECQVLKYVYKKIG